MTTPDQLQARREWVEALEHGDYKQGLNRLHNPQDDSFCCLGVACVATKVAPSRNWGPDNPALLRSQGYGVEGATGSLPREAQDALGLATSEPFVQIHEGISSWVSLVWLNDHGLPFSVIADLIEDQDDLWDGVIPPEADLCLAPESDFLLGKGHLS